MNDDLDAAWAEERARDKRGKLILQAALGALVLIAAAAGLYVYHDRYGISSEERFERELAEDSGAAEVLEPIRKLYPYEYGKLRRASSEAYNLEKTGRVLDHLPGNFLYDFLRRHAVEAIQGGDKETLAFIEAYASFFVQAENNKALCEIIYGNEDKVNDPVIMLGQKAFTRLYASYVTLAATGRSHPIRRSPPSRAEVLAMFNEMRRLDSNPKRDYPPSAQQRCHQANIAAKALASQPPEQQVRLVSMLFQIWR